MRYLGKIYAKQNLIIYPRNAQDNFNQLSHNIQFSNPLVYECKRLGRGEEKEVEKKKK